MAGKSNYAETKTLDGWFGGTPLPTISTMYFALCTVAPNEVDIGTEYTGNGYARASVTNNGTSFPAAVAGNPSTKQNNVTVSFPTVTGADWTGINGWATVDAAGIPGGNHLYFGTFSAVQSVAVGQTASWAAGGLTFSED